MTVIGVLIVLSLLLLAYGLLAVWSQWQPSRSEN
jgi:hypothetical protein